MTVELKERSFNEMITYFNNKVSDMDISANYKMELLGMITAIGYKHEKDMKRKTGKWIKDSDVAFHWKCSECGSYLFWDKEKYLLREEDEPNYCPNCGSYNGAKMEANNDRT